MTRGAAQPDSRSALWALAGILAVGFALRWFGIESHGLSQAESFTPGIPLPDYATAPPARMNLLDTLRTTLWTDVHPPAFYVFMLGWTSVFGSDLAVIRTPSVAFSVLGMLALFAMVRREDGVRVALGAAALLAVNGLDIYFSQRARGWMMAYLLASIATMLLLRLEGPATRRLRLLYLSVATLGLWTSYGFWPFFVGHAAYALLGRMPTARALDALRLQAIALILSSSLVVVLRAQLNHAHDISETILVPALRLFAFNGMVDDVGLLLWQPPLGTLLFGGAAALGGTLLVLGSWNRPSRDSLEPAEAPAHASRAIRTGLPSIGLALAIAAASWLGLRALGISSPHRLVVAPAFAGAVASAWLAIAWLWPRIAPILESLRKQRIARALFADAPTAIVTTFAALLLVTSLAVKPMLVARNLLMVGPLCMWLVARGVLAIPALAPRWAQATAIAAIAVVGALSVTHAHTNLYPNAIGYGPLYAQIESQLRDGDRFAIEANWAAQPMFYYVDFEKYPSRPSSEWLASLRAPGASQEPVRLWMLIWGRDEALEQQLAERGRGFEEIGLRRTQRLDAEGIAAFLFERDAAGR